MKQAAITPYYVNNIPEKLDEGVLYICERYHVAAHKCCCGCGQEVITPLTPADWLIRKDNDLITLLPSIGNWSFACQSHYWIKRNKVVWSAAMSKEEIGRVRAKDKADKQRYIASVNLEKENLPVKNKKQTTTAEAIFAKILRLIKELLK